MEEYYTIDRCRVYCYYWNGQCEICSGTVYTDDDREHDKDLGITDENYRLHHNWNHKEWIAEKKRMDHDDQCTETGKKF